MNLSTVEVEFGICVIDRDLSFERFTELHLGTSEAEALRLGRDLEAASVPLHDIVVADRALVKEAADAIQVFGSRTPDFFGFAGCATEAAVVVGQEAAKTWLAASRSAAPDRRSRTRVCSRGKFVVSRAEEEYDVQNQRIR